MSCSDTFLVTSNGPKEAAVKRELSGTGDASPSWKREQESSRAEQPYQIKQLELMLDSVPALIAYVDNGGRYQWVNRGYQDWYGLSSEDLVGQVALDILKERVSLDYAEQLGPRVEQALAGAEITFEATHHFGGRRHDLRLSYRPDRAADGAVRGFVLLITDQTEQQQTQRKLQASEQQFRTLTEMLPSIIWTASPQGEIDYISSQFREITGLPVEEGMGSGWTQIVHPDDLPSMISCWDAAILNGTSFEVKCRVRQHDGKYRWNLIRSLPERDQSGDVIRWLGISTDIDDQVLAEESARESEKRYRLLFDDNPLPMFTYDTQTLRILSTNDVATEKYGYSREELLQMRVTDIRPQEDVPALLPIMHDPPEGSPIGPFRHRRKDGSAFWVEVTSHSLSGEDPALRIIVAQDVSEQVRLNTELIRRADYDSHTGLPNRMLLMDRFGLAVERAKRTGQRIAVMAIDFDRFKQVNDTFGHRVGDEFLKVSTLRLLSVLRGSDTLARVGGDELIAMADCIDSTQECTEIAERLIAALETPVAVHDLKLQSSISVGIAFYPDDGDDFDEIHRRADFSLYQAKRSGGDCWRFYSDQGTLGIQEAMEIERSLQEALATGRFELHYQPIISSNRKLAKLEALIRLPHPTLGLLPPARFVAVAEGCGLITPIGLWTFREACRQIRQWRNEGLRVVPIAVNVSAAQFLRGNLAEDIRGILKEFGVEPELLEIELTESLLMENTEQSWQQLRLLKEEGVQIAVDDFGTGYSSLSYLHWLPLDRLKIDKSFVQQVTSGGSNSIVRAIIELGKNLGLCVVAEGVETEEQYQELVKMNCELLQGFLFSEPEPAEKIARFLEPNAYAEADRTLL